MEKLKLYTVTKPSTDGTFLEGDIVWLSENSDLNCINGMGFLTDEEWNVEHTNDFEVEECKTHYLYVNDGIESVRPIERKKI